jgi:hypothetical protein
MALTQDNHRQNLAGYVLMERTAQVLLQFAQNAMQANTA